MQGSYRFLCLEAHNKYNVIQLSVINCSLRPGTIFSSILLSQYPYSINSKVDVSRLFLFIQTGVAPVQPGL